MSFELKPATRQGIIPLIGLWGGTGGGKTESAIRLAVGMAGGDPEKVGVLDTEGRRASYYSDLFKTKFRVSDFDAPYSPERYCEALDVLEKSADVGVIDSASHCWEGPDGVLDLHEQALDRMLKDKKDDWSERARMNWPAWREPKMRFAILRNRILAFKKPLVVCFRGKIKSRMEKDQSGRNTVVSDKHTTPIFDTEMIFQMHVAMEVYSIDGIGGHVDFPNPYAKTSHRDIRALLPKQGDQLTVEHGIALAKWCSTPGTGTVQSTTTADPKRELLAELWKLAEPVRGPIVKGQKPTFQIFEVWAAGQSLIGETEEVSAMTIDRLREVIEKAKEKLPK